MPLKPQFLRTEETDAARAGDSTLKRGRDGEEGGEASAAGGDAAVAAKANPVCSWRTRKAPSRRWTATTVRAR